MTRQEHLDWCKKRALQYVDNGDADNAFGSMMSDMKKHPDTSNHAALDLGMGLKMRGLLDTTEDMRKFIEGFN